jgi:hypothetical protein
VSPKQSVLFANRQWRSLAVVALLIFNVRPVYRDS